jgi:hypothetical protein
MLSVIILSVIMLNVIMPRVIMLNVIMPHVIMLSVIMLSVIMLCHYVECHYAECRGALEKKYNMGLASSFSYASNCRSVNGAKYFLQVGQVLEKLFCLTFII